MKKKKRLNDTFISCILSGSIVGCKITLFFWPLHPLFFYNTVYNNQSADFSLCSRHNYKNRCKSCGQSGGRWKQGSWRTVTLASEIFTLYIWNRILNSWSVLLCLPAPVLATTHSYNVKITTVSVVQSLAPQDSANVCVRMRLAVCKKT